MAMPTNQRNHYLYLGKLAQKANRHYEAANFIETIIDDCIEDGGGGLTAEEQGVLTTSYKNTVDSVRKGWRIVCSLGHQEEATRLYRCNLEAKLSDVCDGVLRILDDHLIPSAKTSDWKVYYMKMKGDYYRYIAEIKCGDEKKEAAKHAMLAYNAAKDVAVTDLGLSHPIRLGLLLNMSIFYHDIIKHSRKAESLAKDAIGKAIIDLDASTYRESVKIINLLMKNLALWNANTKVDKILNRCTSL